ncbi:hypothetical protein PIROE2DRAFT_17194 [Piromyces sp. E2]|nr:hypothetical protein PIROE2DRAFT_17194 [Piromyces sp. E2]|eukprot:OUM57725.1 hypothetical protein PIROE2DRAFT_17194 [Piromyces sp. E2]
MSEQPFTYDVTVHSNISLIGNKNGTVFDYKNDKKGRLIFHYYDNKGAIIKMENISFENFNSSGLTEIDIIILYSSTDNIFFIVNKCNIKNNNYRFIRIYYTCNTPSHSNPSIIFNDCNFINNDLGIIKIVHFYNIRHEDLNKCLPVVFNNNNFINNKGLFLPHFSTIVLNNCHISNVEIAKDENDYATFFYSTNTHEDLIINNSVFNNINIKSVYPLVIGDNINLEIKNTTFSNCYTEYGYLFDIKNTEKMFSKQKVSIYNSTFSDICTLFYTDKMKFEISNSKFENITKKESLPLLSNSKYSVFTIKNTVFQNLKLSYGLFDEEAKYTLNNGEVHKKLSINNAKIRNSISNGSFIKIVGDSNEITINNSYINNIKAYGQIIENKSKKTKTILSNINFDYNINKNKLDCGNIYFTNYINLIIENSKFSNNYCENNGGVICINGFSDINVNITSNIFNKNSALNGGSLFIKEGLIPPNRYNTYNIHNNYFTNNTAKNFGGAIYSEFNCTYISDSGNNTITYNNAGIAGGGMFSSGLMGKTLVENNQLIFANNTVNSNINNYSSIPSYVLLNTTLTKKSNNIITGAVLPLKFLLYDEYNNIIEDSTMYYSNLNIKNDVELRFDDIEITVSECGVNQIKMYNHNGILYCEDPLCKPGCPVGESAICIPYYKELINNIEKNRCKCLPGWVGNKCENKNLINFR